MVNASTLNIRHILWRAKTLYPESQLVVKTRAGHLRYKSYHEFAIEVETFAKSLQGLGIKQGDHVATLLWNTWHHLVAYYAIPSIGAVLHTLNPRLHPDDMAYILNNTNDRVLLIEKDFLPLYQRLSEKARFDLILLVDALDDARGTNAINSIPGEFVLYDDLVGSGRERESEVEWPSLDLYSPAFLLHTSGTTGKPKGILFSHGQIALAALTLTSSTTFGISHEDTILQVVPMFHVAGWGLPYAALLCGSKLVLPGTHPRPKDLLDLIQSQACTFAAGVPTVWQDILDEAKSLGIDVLAPKLRVAIGGSPPRENLIRALRNFGIQVIHAWGMSEVLVGLQSKTKGGEESPDKLLWQGVPAPFLEVKLGSLGGPSNDVPWDEKTPGELLVRGPWVADGYIGGKHQEAFDNEGWFHTGDVAVISPKGEVKIVDRTKDLVKSGGEWISSVEVEQGLLTHPGVRDAAVVAVPHPRWQERPVAFVVPHTGVTLEEGELRAHLERIMPKWWIPDEILFVEELPRTPTGKVVKGQLKELWMKRKGGEK